MGLRLRGRVNRLGHLVGVAVVVRPLCLRGVLPRPLLGVITTRLELQVSAAAPVVAVVVEHPHLVDGAVRISHSYHLASTTVRGV